MSPILASSFRRCGSAVKFRLALLLLLAGCTHLSDQPIVDNCRAGGGLTVKACECVRSEMRASMDGYSYDAMVLLANGRDAEAGARLNALTQRDQLEVAAAMMSAYTSCATDGAGTDESLPRSRTISDRRSGQAQQAAAMPDLPVFDSEKTTLSAFLREIEVYCGVTPGSVLELAGGEVVRLRPSIPVSNMKDAVRVMSIAVLALASHVDVAIGVVGGT